MCAVLCFVLLSPSLGGLVLALLVAYAASEWFDDGLAQWRDSAAQKGQSRNTPKQPPSDLHAAAKAELQGLHMVFR